MAELEWDHGTVHIHSASYPPPDPNGKSYVIDGDTIVVGGQHWRLFGYDAPPLRGPLSHGDPHCDEENDKGRRAKEVLEELIRQGSAKNTLRFEIMNGSEKYSRNLFKMQVNGLDVGEILRALGLADYYSGKGPKPIFCSCATRRKAAEASEEDRQFRDAQNKARRQSPPGTASPGTAG